MSGLDVRPRLTPNTVDTCPLPGGDNNDDGIDDDGGDVEDGGDNGMMTTTMVVIRTMVIATMAVMKMAVTMVYNGHGAFKGGNDLLSTAWLSGLRS
jgi:hypothetical protein